jgi:hypothetical protein
VPSEIGEEKVSQKWVREEQLRAPGFYRSRRKGHAIRNLPEGLHTEAVRYKLSVGLEVKMEIP